MRRIIFLAVLASGMCNLGHAQSQELSDTDIRDIHQLDPGRIALRPSRDRIVPVSISRGATNARIGNFVAAEELYLDIGALVAASTDRREAGKAGENYFSLVIEGNEYVLDVVEVTFDPVFGMQQVLAAVVNTAPDAYARFTFDPKSGSI